MKTNILKKAKLILDIRSLCLPISEMMTNLRQAGLIDTDLYIALEKNRE